MSETSIAKSIKELALKIDAAQELLAQFERYAMREMLSLMSQVCRNDPSPSCTDDRLRNLLVFAGNVADCFKAIDGDLNAASGWIALIGDATAHDIESSQRSSVERSSLRVVSGSESGDAA